MTASGFGTGAERSVFNVLKGTADPASGYANYWMFLESASVPEILGDFMQIYSADFDASFNGNFLQNGLDISATVGLQNQSLTTLLKSTSASNLYKDGVSIGSGSGTQSLEDELSIGRFDANYAPQLQQEFIVYNSDKSTDRTDIEGNISAYYQSAKLLDESYGSGAEAAYSVRQLKRANTECMVIRRASDSTTTTIGFDASGNISEADIETFCTGTTCTVYQWLDQSGNGNTATAAAPANEPTIYTGGALVKDGGRLALDFTSDYFDLGDVLDATNGDICAYMIVNPNASTPTYASYISKTAFADVQNRWEFSPNRSNYDPNTSYQITGYQLNAQHVASFEAIGSSALTAHQNGTQAATIDLSSATEITGSPYHTLIGGYGDATATGGAAATYIGKIQEIVAYTVDQSANRTDIESNIGDYFTQNTPLLDTYSGAAAAYSLRLLDSTYTGSAIRVRRSSDNTEQDIGFNVFSELDTVSLLAFAGTGDAFVKVWYDQSGNSNDATQTNTAKQPKIVSSGVVEVDANGNKIAFFDTGSIFENIATFNTSPHTAFAVTQGTGVRTQLYGFGGNNAYLNYSLEHWNGSAFQTFIGDGSTYSDYPSNASWNSDTHLVTSIYNGTTNSLYIDTALDRTDSETKTSSGALSINSRGSRAMYLAEIILYTSDKSSDRAGIESNLNTFYTL